MRRIWPLLLAACASRGPVIPEGPDASELGTHFLAMEGAESVTPSTDAARRARAWSDLPPADAAARFEGTAGPGSVDWLHAAELRLLAGGCANYFRGARDAWRWLQASNGGSGREPELRRRAYRLYNHNLAGYAATVDWSRGSDRVGRERIRLVRRGVAAQSFARIVPCYGLPQGDLPRRVVTSGAGGPVLAAFPRTEERDRVWPHLLPDLYMAPLSAVLDFDDGHATVTLHDPAEGESTPLFGRTVPLKLDFTAAWAAVAEGQADRFEREAERGLRRPDRSLQTIYTLAPPDPRRRIVLFVHGFDSSPRVFRELAIALLADPQVRTNYQFVAYRYATGYSLLLNNAMFRRRLQAFLDRLDAVAPGARAAGIVAIGHSMGGLQIKPLAQSSGQAIWDRVFKLPPGRIPADSPEAKFLRSALLFEPMPEIRRLVFLAVPHRGSPLASGVAATVGKSGIASDPDVDGLKAWMLRTYDRMLRPPIERRLREQTTSVDSLRPDDPYRNILLDLPIAVPFHSVIGDVAGDVTAPTGDGVVPYASAHLDGARSEKILRWGHNLPASPACHEEVRRILLLELGE